GALDCQQARGARDVPAILVQLHADVLALHVIAKLAHRRTARLLRQLQARQLAGGGGARRRRVLALPTLDVGDDFLGQIADTDGVLRQDDQPFDHVAQLAYVAGPAIAAEDGQRLLTDRLHLHAVLAAR